MKVSRFLMILAVLLVIEAAVSASAQSKIATVDMRKIFNNYYKTKLAEDVLDQAKATARKNLKDMADGIDKAQADYKALLDQANDMAISSDARDKLKQTAADKAQEINDSKVNFDKFQREVEAQLADKSQHATANLIDEIQKAVSDKAKLAATCSSLIPPVVKPSFMPHLKRISAIPSWPSSMRVRQWMSVRRAAC